MTKLIMYLLFTLAIEPEYMLYRLHSEQYRAAIACLQKSQDQQQHNFVRNLYLTEYSFLSRESDWSYHMSYVLSMRTEKREREWHAERLRQITTVRRP